MNPQDKIAQQVNAEIQRKMGALLIEQIAAQVEAQAMRDRIAELEAKKPE